ASTGTGPCRITIAGVCAAAVDSWPPGSGSLLKVEGDLYRRRTAPGGAVIDHLDIVAVGIQHESGVIVRMIGPQSRCAVVPPPGGQRRLVNRLHGLPVWRLEGQMMTPCRLAECRRRVQRREHQLIDPDKALATPADRYAQPGGDSGI